LDGRLFLGRESFWVGFGTWFSLHGLIATYFVSFERAWWLQLDQEFSFFDDTFDDLIELLSDFFLIIFAQLDPDMRFDLLQPLTHLNRVQVVFLYSFGLR